MFGHGTGTPTEGTVPNWMPTPSPGKRLSARTVPSAFFSHHTGPNCTPMYAGDARSGTPATEEGTTTEGGP